MTHTKYAEEHRILPQLFSSLGYVHYSPFWGKYKLEHYQGDITSSISGWIKRLKEERRDKLLIYREIQRNPIFKNPKVMRGTYLDLLAFQKRICERSGRFIQ